jgi:L-aminopeptidase/D-esterase-like protein
VVGALAAVNAFGSPVMPGSSAFWAWPYEIGDEFGGRAPAMGLRVAPDDWGLSHDRPAVRESTTLAVVATNLALTPAQARRVAVMAQDGLARALRPVHALFDGDVVFVLSTAERPLPEPVALSLSRLGERAANCLARAISRGVFEARTWPDGPPEWRGLA